MSAAPIPRSGQTMPKQLHPNKRTGTGPGWEVAGGPILLQKSPIPRTSPLASAEFATIRERLIKIGARVIEHIARIRVHLPTSCPEAALFRTVAVGLLQSGP
jgi:hypothetical protein